MLLCLSSCVVVGNKRQVLSLALVNAPVSVALKSFWHRCRIAVVEAKAEAVAVVIGQKLKTFVAAVYGSGSGRGPSPGGETMEGTRGTRTYPGNKWALQISKQDGGVGPELGKIRGTIWAEG